MVKENGAVHCWGFTERVRKEHDWCTCKCWYEINEKLTLVDMTAPHKSWYAEDSGRFVYLGVGVFANAKDCKNCKSFNNPIPTVQKKRTRKRRKRLTAK